MNPKSITEISKRYIQNRLTGKPLYVGVEPLWTCNANCDFCGYRRSNPQKKIEEKKSYRDILSHLNPIMTGFAGGETLIRKDLEVLVAEAKDINIPFVSITTNGSLLTQLRYYSLVEAGLDNLNISLDFPDQRHNNSRGIPKLYEKIEDFLDNVKITSWINLNVILMKENADDMQKFAKLAKEKGIGINAIPYTALRANVHSHEIEGLVAQNALRDLRQQGVITNSEIYLDKVQKYFLGEVGTCDAGRSFLWVLPDGSLRACNILDDSLPAKGTIQEQLATVRSFKTINDCNSCYSNCRGESEAAASLNPIVLGKLAVDRILRYSKRLANLQD